jgi:nitrite reductase (NO-forming)
MATAESDRTLDHSANTAFAFVLVVFGLFGAIALAVAILIGLGGGDGTPAASTAAANAGPKTVQITLADLSVTPSSIDVPAGTDLTLHVMNTGALVHNLTVDGGAKTSDLAPGAMEDLHIGLVADKVEAYCSIPGHKAAGMVLEINVTGEVAAGDTATTSQAFDATDAKVDFNASPGPDWKPFDPQLAPAPGGTDHQITFHMKEQVREVAPGVTQEMWTFNEQVPGPVLRGKVGDVFSVTVVNDGKMGHSIDFHASQTSMDQDMRTLQPGESLVYQFTADYAGIWMYHCGTAPVLHHVGNGMYGAVIIDPPDLAAVNHEYVMIQSELYTGPAGQPGDLAKMLADEPDAVMFNGYVNQYKYAPITGINAGERVRIWVLDVGPSDISSFHIVGTIFDTVFKEGAYLLRPANAEQGGSQALDLMPAQGGFVELSFAKPGMYDMVNHKFVDASRGALGIFHVG